MAGDVKIAGVDVKTGSVSGTVGGNTTVESVQDEFYSEGRGYSAGISAGIGRGLDRKNPGRYGVNLSSVSAGHTRTDVEQRITRNVTEFTAGAGFLDVKGTVKQVGSLIDGNFTLSSNGYEHEDLKDIDKSRTVGINVTVYPNVSYSQRDRNGNQVYVDGSNPKKTGMAVKTGLTYGETDRTREILATVGAGLTMNHDLSGVNRDPDRQVTEFEGRELKPVNVDLLAEYWATEAGRGKLRDMLEDAERTTDGIRRVLTTRDSNGNLQILKSVEAESAVQKFMRIGYVDTRGKTQQQVKQELEARFGSLAKKGVKVNFYDNRDIDAKNLDETSLSKLTANGFAITEDGTVWINKSFVDSGKVIDFNKVTQHEISHIIFGKDSEFQAQYLESAYGSFLEGISENGYLHDNAGITDYDTSSLSMFDRMLLNSYILDQIQLWEPTRDDRIDRVVRVTHLMPEVQQKRNISIIGRLEKIYKPGNKERERRRKDIETRVRKKKIAENNKKKPSDKKNSKELEKEIAKEVNTKLKTSDITNIEGQDVKMLFKEIEADRKMGITQKENIMFKETVKKHPEMIDAYFRKSRKDRIDEIRMLDFYKQKTDKLGLTSKQIADFTYIANEAIYDELWSKSPGENYKSRYSNVNYKVLDRIDMLSGLQAVLIQDPNKKGNAIMVFQGSNPGITDRKKDPINWDKDWSNNSENISSLTSVLSVPSTIFGNTFNIIGQGIKNAGNAISSSSVVKISEYGGVPSEFNSLSPYMNNVGNFTILPTSEIGRRIRAIGDSVVKRSEAVGFLSKKEYYKSYEKNTPKQYTDSLKLVDEWEKKHKVKITDALGHSLGYGTAIYTASHKNIRAVGVDPAPVRNPGKYIDNNKILMLAPNDGNGMLNSITSNPKGGVTYYFAPLIGIPIPGMSNKTYGIPAVPVKAKIRDEKKDTHSADTDSVFQEIQYIHRMIGVE